MTRGGRGQISLSRKFPSLLSAVVLSSPTPELSCIPGGPCQADNIPQGVIEFAKRKLKQANNGLLRSCSMSLEEGTFSQQVLSVVILLINLTFL